MQNIKLLISVMSSRGWTPQFGESICNMLVHLASKGVRNHNITFTTYFLRGASLPAVGRQMAVKRALAEDYTHLLMIDDDHQFPADMCDVLFSRKVPVVAANLLKKNPEKVDGTATTIRDEPQDPRGRTDIEEASLVGTGIILINVNSIRHIPQPLFDNPYISEEVGHLGEDYYFCEKAKEYGIKIYVDNLISNTATHVGDYGFHWGSNFPLDKHSHIGMAPFEKPIKSIVKQALPLQAAANIEAFSKAREIAENVTMNSYLGANNDK